MRAEQRFHNLVVKFCNEQTLVFALKEKPIATLHADSLIIQTAQFHASYLRDEICDFYFLQAPKDTTSLPQQTIYITYINDHTIRINGVQKGDNAALYSIDGKLLLTQTINNNEYILDLSAYARGLYLIQLIHNLNNTSNKQQIISFKIIR
jgi:hypothetical protein